MCRIVASFSGGFALHRNLLSPGVGDQVGLVANVVGLIAGESDDGFRFVHGSDADDGDAEDGVVGHPWRVLVTDDDDEVHRATTFSLRGVLIDGRPIELLHAHSAIEAESILRATSDVAVAVLDVVMETPDAGLKLVDTIRNTLCLNSLRIVLRTGQAGYAPEVEVFRRYDINDYRTKSELTQIRLVTTLTAAVRAFAQLEHVAAVNRGMDTVARATNAIFRLRSTREFASTLLNRVGDLLNVPVNGVVCVDRLTGQDSTRPGLTVVCGAGEYASATGLSADESLPLQVLQGISRCQAAKTCLYDARRFFMWLGCSSRDAIAVFEPDRPLLDVERRLVDVFAANLSVGLENIDLIERLDFFAFFDPLTHLPNRTRFLSDVDQDLFSRSGGTRCLAISDVVRFSEVNDALGHRCGDSLLIAVSKRLRAALGPGVRIARIAGDAFGIYGAESAIDANRIRRAFEAPFFVHGHSLSVQMRLGMARVGGSTGSAVDLLRDANLALNQARATGGGGVSVYSGSLAEDVRSRVSMVHALRTAIDFKRGLSVHYQPVVNAASRTVVGAEALLRWRGDSGEMICPERFIPLAESTGMINELGLWVIEVALDHLSVLNRLGYPDLRMSINVSPAQFRSEDFSDRVRQIVEHIKVLPKSIMFELTESIGLEDRDRLESHLRVFKEIGIQMAIDDFGTGFSSLNQLISLPADVVKVDRRFVKMLADSDEDRAVTASVVGLARGRKLGVVAEGVETAEQVSILMDMGCETMQGFYFGRPMNAEQFDAWLQAFDPR